MKHFLSELRDNVNPHLRHLAKYVAQKSYRAGRTPFRTRLANVKTSFLRDALAGAPVTVCDVGAFYIKSIDPGTRKFLHEYAPGHIVLVEPQADLAAAIKKVWEKEFGAERVSVIEHVIGDGSDVTFRICNESAASAGFEPNLDYYNSMMRHGKEQELEVVRAETVPTKTLDQVLKTPIDLLVMDIQGMELSVLTSAPKTLSHLCVVECEADFQELYRGQPLFGDVHSFLRSRGFELFTFRKFSMNTMKEFKARPSYTWYPWRSNYFEPREITYSQPVFVRRNFSEYRGSHTGVVKAAFVLERIYGAFDRAYRLLKDADSNFRTNIAEGYFASLPAKIKS